MRAISMSVLAFSLDSGVMFLRILYSSSNQLEFHILKRGIYWNYHLSYGVNFLFLVDGSDAALVVSWII